MIKKFIIKIKIYHYLFLHKKFLFSWTMKAVKKVHFFFQLLTIRIYSIFQSSFWINNTKNYYFIPKKLVSCFPIRYIFSQTRRILFLTLCFILQLYPSLIKLWRLRQNTIKTGNRVKLKRLWRWMCWKD